MRWVCINAPCEQLCVSVLWLLSGFWGGSGVVVCGVGCWGWPVVLDKVGLDDTLKMVMRKTILRILSGTVLLVAMRFFA